MNTCRMCPAIGNDIAPDGDATTYISGHFQLPADQKWAHLFWTHPGSPGKRRERHCHVFQNCQCPGAIPRYVSAHPHMIHLLWHPSTDPETSAVGCTCIYLVTNQCHWEGKLLVECTIFGNTWYTHHSPALPHCTVKILHTNNRHTCTAGRVLDCLASGSTALPNS